MARRNAYRERHKNGYHGGGGNPLPRRRLGWRADLEICGFFSGSKGFLRLSPQKKPIRWGMGERGVLGEE